MGETHVGRERENNDSAEKMGEKNEESKTRTEKERREKSTD